MNPESVIEPLLDPANERFTIKPIKFNQIWEMYKKQQSMYWKAEEIDFSKDYDHFIKLDKDEQHFIKMVLAFFASSDGIVNFNLRERFLKEIKITEAQVAYSWQMMMENIHCVSANTKILTDEGYINIGDNENKIVNVWNGEQFSNVIIKYTGDSKLYQIELSNGMTLNCTPEHKWFTEMENKKSITYTKDLKENDIIYHYDLPLINCKDPDNFLNPYLHGFLCGDSINSNSFYLSLYEDKKDLIDLFNTKYSIKKYSVQNDKYTFDITNLINKEKYYVPINYSLETKIRWLEGFADNNTKNIFSNNNLDFVKNIQLMLTTMGIHSHIELHDNNYILCIYDPDRLITLGFSPKKFKTFEYQNIKKPITIKNIKLLSGIHKTYCFNEPLQHAGIFNGILTGQSEVYSNMLENIVKDSIERDKLFNSIKLVPSIEMMANWAFKWIESKDSISYRIIAFAAVEGIFFCGAFAAIFWLKKYRSYGENIMDGLIKSNQLICRDESEHVNFACYLYSIIVNRLDKDTVHNIIGEAVEISKIFNKDAIKCQLIGMNYDLMCQYIEYVGDRLLIMLGYEKKYHTTNPFEFMESIGLLNKTNFFESRPTEYQSAHTTKNIAKNTITILKDF